MSLVNYEEIRLRNIEEYGKGTRHLAYLSDLYETRTHFLYELLQNAEDALAKREKQAEAGYVDIRLHEDNLELRHNGKPFDEKDVIGICGIGEGTKAGDYSQIGKFGIGFKSVYAYTLAPRIHSNREHFEVRRFVEPHALSVDTVPSNSNPNETCVVLPFDSQSETQTFREYVPPDQAVKEIGVALKNLGLRTLLFLNFIREIRWSLPDGVQGTFQRSDPRTIVNNPAARYVDITDGSTNETWLIFRRNTEVTDAEGKPLVVEVGFLIQGEKVTRANNTELVVSFPTTKRTELGFLIQGPFKTTKARDNIEDETKAKANPQLIETAAQLAADSLESLCDLGLIHVESFKALPLKSSVFQDDNTRFFWPVYQAIRQAIKSKRLLPKHKGGFVAANEARLASSGTLAEIFSSEQLRALFGVEHCFWLDTAITAGRMTELRDYLVGKRKSRTEWEQEPLIEGVEVEAKDIAAKLTTSFLQVQEEAWLADFYKYLDKNFEPYRETPFVRLEDGKHTTIFQAYLPPRDSSGITRAEFPLVKQSLVENQDALVFLRDKAKLREPDAVDVVIKCLMPKYKLGDLRFDQTEYEHDLKRIISACNGEGRHRMANTVKNTKFIACTPARVPESIEVVWKAPADQSVFIRSPELEAWFAENNQDEAWFVCPAAIQIIQNNRIGDIEVGRQSPVFGCEPSNRGKVRLKSEHSSHKQGLDGFNPDAQIFGLDYSLQHWNQKRARYLWSVLLDISHLIKGDVQQESNMNRLDAATRTSTYSKFGLACVEAAWLPDQTGVPRKPKELLLSELLEGFESVSIRAKEVAEKLSMKQPEREQALEMVTAGDETLKQIIDLYQSGSDSDREKLKKMIPREVPPQPAPPFKDGLKALSRLQRGEFSPGSSNQSTVTNPGRYQNKLDESVEDAVKAHLTNLHTVTFSPVRIHPSNSDARNFLYSEYQGRCQLTGHTFLKASATAEGAAENYFEACALLSYSNASYLNDAGNMLCVSADTMAKFKHASVEWVDDLEEVIERFNNREPGNAASARIRLAGEEVLITWSERHFMRLIALWKKA